MMLLSDAGPPGLFSLAARDAREPIVQPLRHQSLAITDMYITQKREHENRENRQHVKNFFVARAAGVERCDIWWMMEWRIDVIH